MQVAYDVGRSLSKGMHSDLNEGEKGGGLNVVVVS